MVLIEGAEVGWAHVGEMFSLDPSISHLSHGTFGAMPVAVQRAQQRIRDEAEANPIRFYADDLLPRIGHTRDHIARFLGADPAGTALVGNATAGIALALNTVSDQFRPGMEIITTNHGYGSIDLNLERWCARRGIAAVKVDIPLGADESEILQRFQERLDAGRVLMAIVDQITSPTAYALPLAPILALLRDAGVISVVDGAHAPGQVDLNVDAIGADFWVGNLHKWAFAARGSAAVVVAPAWRSAVEPLIVSWEQPSGFPLSVEFAGTLDYSPWLCAPTALHVLRTLEPDRVRAYNIELVRYGQQIVGAALHRAGLGGPPDRLPGNGGEDLAMRLVPLPGPATVTSIVALRREISARLGAEVAVTRVDQRGYLRLSAQIYNTRGDYDRLASGLPALLG